MVAKYAGCGNYSAGANYTALEARFHVEECPDDGRCFGDIEKLHQVSCDAGAPLPPHADGTRANAMGLTLVHSGQDAR